MYCAARKFTTKRISLSRRDHTKTDLSDPFDKALKSDRILLSRQGATFREGQDVTKLFVG
jgi:hypothetical protein